MSFDMWPLPEWTYRNHGFLLPAEICESPNVNGNWTDADGGACHASTLSFTDFITATKCEASKGTWMDNTCVVGITSDFCTNGMIGGTWRDDNGGTCTFTVKGFNAAQHNRRAPAITGRSLEQCDVQWIPYLPEVLAVLIVVMACLFGVFKFSEAVRCRKISNSAAARQVGEKECQERYVGIVHHDAGV